MSARLRVVARSSRVDLIVDCIVIDVERCFVEDVCTRPVMDENAFASDVQVLGEAREARTGVAIAHCSRIYSHIFL